MFTTCIVVEGRRGKGGPRGEDTLKLRRQSSQPSYTVKAADDRELMCLKVISRTSLDQRHACEPSTRQRQLTKCRPCRNSRRVGGSHTQSSRRHRPWP